MGAVKSAHCGHPYPNLPDAEPKGVTQSYVYTGTVPVFYGHYWRTGEPEHLVDWTARTACVDFSAVNKDKGGALTAYQWSGSPRSTPETMCNWAADHASGHADITGAIRFPQNTCPL